jgi:hypothetical protein
LFCKIIYNLEIIFLVTGSPSPEELRKWYTDISKQYPMKRVCEVNKIAGVVSFLVGPDFSYTNGQMGNI